MRVIVSVWLGRGVAEGVNVGVGIVGDGVVVSATVCVPEGMSRELATGVGEAVGLPEEHPESIITAKRTKTIL